MLVAIGIFIGVGLLIMVPSVERKLLSLFNKEEVHSVPGKPEGSVDDAICRSQKSINKLNQLQALVSSFEMQLKAKDDHIKSLKSAIDEVAGNDLRIIDRKNEEIESLNDKLKADDVIIADLHEQLDKAKNLPLPIPKDRILTPKEHQSFYDRVYRLIDFYELERSNFDGSTDNDTFAKLLQDIAEDVQKFDRPEKPRPVS